MTAGVVKTIRVGPLLDRQTAYPKTNNARQGIKMPNLDYEAAEKAVEIFGGQITEYDEIPPAEQDVIY